MKVWAQDEFDLVKTGADGQYRFGKGDFRRVNMRAYAADYRGGQPAGRSQRRGEQRDRRALRL